MWTSVCNCNLQTCNFINNGILHRSFSKTLINFSSFIVDQRNTLFCRMLLNGCFGNQAQIMRSACFHCYSSFLYLFLYFLLIFKNVCIHFRRTFSKRRELVQKLPDLSLKQSIRDLLQNSYKPNFWYRKSQKVSFQRNS